VNDKFNTWIIKGQREGVVTDKFGLSVRRTWTCRADGRDLDVLSIVAICDWVSFSPMSILKKRWDGLREEMGHN